MLITDKNREEMYQLLTGAWVYSRSYNHKWKRASPDRIFSPLEFSDYQNFKLASPDFRTPLEGFYEYRTEELSLVLVLSEPYYTLEGKIDQEVWDDAAMESLLIKDLTMQIHHITPDSLVFFRKKPVDAYDLNKLNWYTINYDVYKKR